MQTNRFDPETLRAVLDNLASPETLDEHPWVGWVVPEYLKGHPERGELAAGQILGWALADLWRQYFMPQYVEREFKPRWNTFFVLEAGYFYPFRKGEPFPKTLAGLGRLLADSAHPARLVSDGDGERARELTTDGHAPFWKAMVPDAGMDGVPPQTLVYRRDAALTRMCDALNRHYAPRPGASGNAVVPSPTPATEGATPEGAPAEAMSALERWQSLLLPPEPHFVPPEWSVHFETALATPRLFVHAKAGEGKSLFLAALAHWLQKQGRAVLVMNVRDYARVALEKSPLEYVQTGDFQNLGLARGAREALAEDLGKAERGGRLWVLADDADDLLDAECGTVAARLAGFRHLTLAERASRLRHLLQGGDALRLPEPTLKSAVTFVGWNRPPKGLPLTRLLDPLENGALGERAVAPLAWHGLAARAWAEDAGRYHPATVAESWVERRLLGARSARDATTVGVGAMLRFLTELAAQRLGLDNFGHGVRLGDEALARSAHPAEVDAHPHALADRACRAGLLERGEAGDWRFAHEVVEGFLAAEYLARHPSGCGWAAMHRRFRTAMRWAAALLARRGDEAATEAFFGSILGLVPDQMGMRWLALADLLAEFEGFPSHAAAGLKADVKEKLSLLASVGSARLRQVAVEKARVLGLELPDDGRAFPEERFVADLSEWRGDLGQLLSCLGTRNSVSEAAALEDRETIGALVHRGLAHADRDIALQTAAWLRESSLSPVISAQLFPPRVWDAMEEVAAMAVDPALPDLTRTAAWSALRRAEFIPSLAAKGERYWPLVYTLCLEMDERVWQTRRGNGSGWSRAIRLLPMGRCAAAEGPGHRLAKACRAPPDVGWTAPGSGLRPYTLRDGVDDAMRMTPDYLVVGEVRDGHAAQALFRAMMSDHPGMGTFHAESPQAAIDRMALLLETDTGMSDSAARRLFTAAVDWVQQGGFEGNGRRRILELVEASSRYEDVRRLPFETERGSFERSNRTPRTAVVGTWGPWDFGGISWQEWLCFCWLRDFRQKPTFALLTTDI